MWKLKGRASVSLSEGRWFVSLMLTESLSFLTATSSCLYLWPRRRRSPDSGLTHHVTLAFAPHAIWKFKVALLRSMRPARHVVHLKIQTGLREGKLWRGNIPPDKHCLFWGNIFRTTCFCECESVSNRIYILWNVRTDTVWAATRASPGRRPLATSVCGDKEQKRRTRGEEKPESRLWFMSVLIVDSLSSLSLFSLSSLHTFCRSSFNPLSSLVSHCPKL